MSRHEGVSCDVCLKNNFKGCRYKCLVCYDYDLCAACYENQNSSINHSASHPMQCIITKSDFDFYYGGENITAEQPQSFVCPLCGKMGFSEAKFHAHITAEHSVDSNAPNSSYEVVCPICASLPGGDPNHLTDDLPSHLVLEHRSGSREEDQGNTRHPVRRIQHGGKGMANRTRRSNINFNRDSMDPIAELLSQLSGVRRTTGQNNSSSSSHLQQIQMQMQFERQQAARQQLDRLPRRQGQITMNTSSSGVTASSTTTAVNANVQQNSYLTSSLQNNLLISRCLETTLSEKELEELDVERANRLLFIQEILLGTISDIFSYDKCFDLSVEEESSKSQSNLSKSFQNNQNLLPCNKINPIEVMPSNHFHCKTDNTDLVNDIKNFQINEQLCTSPTGMISNNIQNKPIVDEESMASDSQPRRKLFSLPNDEFSPSRI